MDAPAKTTAKKSKSMKPMVWNTVHDEMLCREILVVDPFTGTKKGTVARGTEWEEVAENLNKIQQVYFKVDKRAVRDRYNLLSKELRNKLKREEKESGIETDMTEVEMALEELIEKEDAAETEQRVAENQKKVRDSQDRENVESVRKKAIERLGQTQKRKADEGESEGKKKKKRSSGSDTLAFLREKNEQLQEIQKQELELKKQQLEVESQKQDNFMQMMLNQQQQQQPQMQDFQGFFHEQSRSDRDKYVKIYWQNILDGFSDQFDKYSWRTIDHLGVSYDYQSLMHYHRMAFTKNGKPTILAIDNENMEFGTPEGRFSARDVVKINALYDCKTISYGWTSWSDWTPCDDDCYRTRERYCYHSGNIQSCGGNVNVYGVEADKQKCPSSICPAPIDGNWGRWSNWGSCTKTCNDGVRRRARKCNNPPPNHNGKPCPGSGYDNKMCILKRCNLDEDDVDFENSRLGMWKNSYIDNLNWKFSSGHTQTIDTGPSRDHTSGSGHYLYVESSYTQPGERADLVSPWITAKNGGQCLKFYYTMYGKTMGTLAIKLEKSNGVSWFIFYEKGNKGMGWIKGSGNIDIDVGFRYQLTIQGTIGQGEYSDIAIDDVYIDDGLCKCQDDYHTCHIWAANGECTTNEVWMRRHCKKSCKVCQGVISTCEDNTKHKVHCPGWAKNGECEKNPGFMKVNCRKSCNTCGVTLPNPSCQDNSKHKAQCPAYAYNGECQKNTVFMKVNCRVSCGICVPVCKDSHKSCPGWAKLGECSKNPAYMKVNCKLSCKQCLGM